MYESTAESIIPFETMPVVKYNGPVDLNDNWVVSGIGCGALMIGQISPKPSYCVTRVALFIRPKKTCTSFRGI